ncbi:MAG TPA: hypothetical protein DDW65_21890 [Firmicutes bacterium]|nr:hypothetical protein [Bacillota bacterium]
MGTIIRGCAFFVNRVVKVGNKIGFFSNQFPKSSRYLENDKEFYYEHNLCYKDESLNVPSRD